MIRVAKKVSWEKVEWRIQICVYDFVAEEIDETYGVNVEFEESGDEDDGDEDEVREDEGDLSEGEEAKMDYTIQEKNFTKTVIICLF